MVIPLILLLAQAPAAPSSAAPATQSVPAPSLDSLFPEEKAPSEAALGLPVYPTAVFLTSYDAGRGQRYYLYGATAGFSELVAYYRTLLKDRGNAVYDQPPTHIFEVGRYSESTMAFPPSVTIKDYSAGGGFLNPKPGATPERFPSIIQVVPAPR